MDEKSSEEYSQFREKVIDVEIRYSPTPEEAANLVFTQEPDINKKLIELSIKLEIQNIRILSKIKKLVNLAVPLLKGYEEEVLHQVAHTVTIAALCYYSHSENVPTYEYLKNSRRSYFGLGENHEKPAHEKNWDALLTRYDFRYTDDFDNVLFSVIESGYIEESSFVECANQQNEIIKANKSHNSFSGAWELYHNSFFDNEAELVKALTDALNVNGRHVDPLNLNSTVRLLKKLGKSDEATQLITTYIDLNKDKSELFDLGSYPFAGEIDDPEVVTRFNETFNESKEIKSLDDVLESMVGKDGWGSSDEEVLTATTTEQFYEFFKKQNNKNLSTYIDICLRFGRFQTASEQYKAIANKAENALKMIANENRLNKIRVQRFGINIDQES